MFAGAMVAIVTPFKDGVVDENALRGLVELQIAGGTDAIIPCGTTGESATLSHKEHQLVVDIVIDAVAGRVPVIAGTGSNNTAEAIRLTQYARDAGADGALLITPYYNKPSQEGLYQHFKAVAESVDIPLVLYNVPSRTSVDMLAPTVARLARLPNIVAIKEATGSMQRASEIMAMCDPDFYLLSGDDFTFFPQMCVGGRGVISVTSNIAPALIAGIYDAFAAGQWAEAAAGHHRLQKLCTAMFLETNPVPVKTALAMMGKVEDEIRLPLTLMASQTRSQLQQVLQEYELI
ncbi:MAG: 4-hydroxy-tetrahydrodipicolinate synthase [Deltaproteobacteria bacterium]|nr:4-hydroxy-tetrahydrodipicolinate synthase [Deltaproteobacteria bacterium]